MARLTIFRMLKIFSSRDLLIKERSVERKRAHDKNSIKGQEDKPLTAKRF